MVPNGVVNQHFNLILARFEPSADLPAPGRGRFDAGGMAVDFYFGAGNQLAQFQYRLAAQLFGAQRDALAIPRPTRVTAQSIDPGPVAQADATPATLLFDRLRNGRAPVEAAFLFDAQWDITSSGVVLTNAASAVVRLRLANQVYAEVKKHFQPEFINRLDRIVVFRSLTDTGLRSILDLELGKVQDRLLSIGKFILLDVSQRAKDFLLAEGTNAEYGARELRRTIERFLVSRVTRVVATEQAKSGDIILADYDPDEKKMTFHLQAGVVDLPPDLNFSVTDLSKIPVSDGKQTLVSPRRTDPSSGDGTARAKIGPPIGSRNESGKCTACGAPWTIFHYCDKRRSELYGKRWGKCGLGEPMSGCDCIACRVIRKSMEREGKKWPPEQ